MPVLSLLYQTILRAIALTGLLAGAVSSQQLTLSVTNEALQERLLMTSLVLQAEAETSAADLVATARGDYERLLAALYDEGYFGASISIRMNGREVSQISPFNPPANVRPIEVRVDPGPRFTFGRAEVTPLAPGSAGTTGLAPGQAASTSIIRNAASTAIDDWRDASHAKAQITGQRITARHAVSELDVELFVAPGPALTFGRLVVPPDTSVRPERVLTIAGLPTGAAFSPDDVTKARSRLVATGTFSSVVAREAELPNADGSLDIELELDPAPLRRLGFGAELSSTEGLTLETFWLHRNFFVGAERLRFDAGVSGIGGNSGGVDYSVRALLSIPGFHRADDQLDISAAFERLDEAAFEQSLIEFGARRSREVSEEFEIGLLAGFRFSESTDAFGTREFSHVTLLADAVLDRRDDSLNPTSGYFLSAAVEPFIGFSDSETGVVLRGDARAYRALGERTVVAGRFQIGSIQGASVEGTPPDLLFFSGGGGTVRGQGFQSLGVPLPGDELTGGQSFAGLSLELRQGITEALGVVGFVDYGFVAREGDFADGDSQAGAGIGLRYNTAFGPLRVDVGVPIGGSSDDDTTYGLYIGLGQAF